jgi:hypothetical protein
MFRRREGKGEMSKREALRGVPEAPQVDGVANRRVVVCRRSGRREEAEGAHAHQVVGQGMP